LDTLDGYPRREGVTASLICDFALTNTVTHEVIVTDVQVTHPDRTDPACSQAPLVAAEHNWRAKQHKYVTSYNIDVTTIQPLVFEVYGGWAQGTYEFLHIVVQAISGGDDKIFASLWQDLRDRIAVTLATGQAAVINYFNFKNSEAPWTVPGPISDGNGSQDTTTTTSTTDLNGLAPSLSM
jgi:hypothetical protein